MEEILKEKIIEELGKRYQKKSQETYTHAKNVERLIKEFLFYLTEIDFLSLSKEEIEEISKGAFLHDIGKIYIPDSILNKKGKLTSEEYELMKKHTIYGKDIIVEYLEKKRERYLEYAKLISISHHEKWNGSGYPLGLKENEIYIYGQIVSIVDVYDALVSKRCYKTDLSNKEIINIFLEERGKSFNPILLDLFIKFKKFNG